MTANLNTASIKAGSGTASRTLSDRFSDVLNVKDFGAVGDFSHDDTSAIQAALDQAFGTSSSPHGNSASLNRPVYLPAGRYKITAPLLVTDVKGGRIYGDGWNCSQLVWAGAFNGNTVPGGADNTVTPIFITNGFGFSVVEGLGFMFGNSQDKNTACVYGYGQFSSSGVEWKSCVVDGGSYGFLLGAGSPSDVSEWTYKNTGASNCGTAGWFITGQNTLNHRFYACGANTCGRQPLTAVVTGYIVGTTWHVTAVTSGTIQPGFLVYDTTGAVKGNTLVNPFGTGGTTGTGGTGTYDVTVSQTFASAGSPAAMEARAVNIGGLININGSIPIVAGFDGSNNVVDVADYSSNAFTISGVRTESPSFLAVGSGTAAEVSACAQSASTGTATATTTGTILHVSAIISAPVSSGGTGIVPGFIVRGTDGVNSLPASGSNTIILKQINGTPEGVGDYLMSAAATPGDISSSVTVTFDPVFIHTAGQGQVDVSSCGGGGVMMGDSNSLLRIKNNQFTPSAVVNPRLFTSYPGQLLEYDVDGTNAFTVANLPTPTAGMKGLRMFVTDSNITASGNFATNISGHGSGSNTVPVFCDGASWLIG